LSSTVSLETFVLVTELKGKSTGLLTGSVNVSGGLSVKQEVETGVLQIDDVRRSKIELKSASADVRTDSDDYTSTSPKKVSINSFSGDMMLFINNSTIVLDGKVDRLDSGDFSFGS